MMWPCVIRPARESDEGFIAHSWVESYHRGCKELRGVAFRPYRSAQFWRVSRLLEASTALVACDPDDADHLLGWVVADGPLLHYVYASHLRRRARLASTLLDAVEVANAKPLASYSHQTEAGRKLLRGRAPLLFDPVSLWRL